MEISKLKSQERVIVRMPAPSTSQAPIEVEATIHRINKERTALVVKTDEGKMHTLPIVNVVRYAEEQEANETASTEANEVGKQVHEAVLDGKEPTNETAKEIVKEIKKEEKPVKETKAEENSGNGALAAAIEKGKAKGAARKAKKEAPAAEKKEEVKKEAEHPIMTMAKEAAEEAATPVTKAKDVMEEVDELSNKAKATLKELKPSQNKDKAAPKKGLTVEQRAERKALIKQLLIEGKLKNKEIADQAGCDPAYVSDVKKAMIANNEFNTPEAEQK